MEQGTVVFLSLNTFVCSWLGLDVFFLDEREVQRNYVSCGSQFFNPFSLNS
jgi:hypothetical protein